MNVIILFLSYPFSPVFLGDWLFLLILLIIVIIIIFLNG